MEGIIKILSFSFLLELSHIVDAKFCAFEQNGEPKYYVCPQNEYCCNFGCCVSPAFQFYQLWYYWLLVIFMFLLCSGGGWWYRYWLQSQYRTGSGSALHTIGPSHQQSRPTPRTSGTHTRRSSTAHMAHVSYNSARDTVVLNHIWKGLGTIIPRSCPPPSYSSAQVELCVGDSNNTTPHHNGSSHPAMLHPTAASLFPLPGHVPHLSTGTTVGQELAYYQLYGPPPSYDSVISDRGTVSASRQVNNAGSVTSPTSEQTCPVETTNDTTGNTVAVRNFSAAPMPETVHSNENVHTERTNDLLLPNNYTLHNAYRGPSTNEC